MKDVSSIDALNYSCIDSY